MRSNGAPLIAALLLALLFGASCDQVIALDKGLDNAEGSTADKQSGEDMAAGGNPAEDIAEGADSPSGNALSDSAASADTAAPALDDEWNSDGLGDEEAVPDADSGAAAPDDAYEAGDASATDEDPTSSFTYTDCDCGETPDYAPICCDGHTTVFNKCFANCINYYTGQCATQQDGTCAAQGGENDSDSDTEVSDDDAISVGTCGCVPTDMSAWCCDDGDRYVGQCTATCECEGTPAPCR